MAGDLTRTQRQTLELIVRAGDDGLRERSTRAAGGNQRTLDALEARGLVSWRLAGPVTFRPLRIPPRIYRGTALGQDVARGC